MATPGQARPSLVRASPCPRLMRGPSRHHELSAASTRFSVVPRLALPGATSTGDPVGGGRRSGLVVERAAALDVGKEQVVASRPRPCRRGRSGSRASPPGGPHLPDVHLQPGDPGGLAAGRGRHPGGDGGHRAVLEADLVGAGGARAGAAAGQAPATSSSCPAARPTSATPPGCASCWSVGCCGAASCPRRRSASCGILSATASG
jgi:hypothetical protein